MFAKTIVLSDAFLDMPMTARCLYFTLGMLADDDGFVNSPKSIMRQCGATIDDLKVLLAKKYLLDFDDGVIVIKHWRINNYLQKDRMNPTVYLEHKDTLAIDEKGAYTRKEDQYASDVYTEPTPVYTQDRLGKDSIGKVIEKESKEKETPRRFTPPTLEEVTAYCRERNNNIDPQHFIDYYSSNGWMVGRKNKMADWKAAIRNWERNGYHGPKTVVNNLDDTDLDEVFDAFRC